MFTITDCTPILPVFITKQGRDYQGIINILSVVFFEETDFKNMFGYCVHPHFGAAMSVGLWAGCCWSGG